MANENEGVQTTAETTEQTKYLDKDGLKTFWGKVKALVTAAVATLNTAISDHASRTDNPHKVTKGQVGLGNVDNTSDTAKPVSTAQATAIADAKKAGTDAASALTDHKNAPNPHGITKSTVGLGNVTNDAQVKRSEMGKANGVATLGSDGKVPESQLPTLDLSLYIIVDDLPTTGQKTNKIYLKKNLSKPGNVYTEYVWVNNAWEKLGDYSSEVDLKPYAKLAGGNTFTGTQTVVDDDNNLSKTTIEPHRITIGSDMGTMTITEDGITTSDESDFLVFNTNGGTVNMGDYVAESTYNTDKTTLTNAINGKLDKTGGTISGNLAVTGTLTKGGKAVLTDHQAIYSLTVQKNGSTVGTFNPKNANATVNVTVPTKLSELTDNGVLSGKYLPLTGGTLTGDLSVGGSITSGGVGVALLDDLDRKVDTYAEIDPLNNYVIHRYDITHDDQVTYLSIREKGEIWSASSVTASKIVKTNATAKQLLCGDGSVAERIDETEIAIICV